MEPNNLTTQLPLGDQKEQESRPIFLQNLPRGRFKDTPMGEKSPDFDGYIDIFNAESRNTGMHFNYQLKSTDNAQQNYYDCERKFLNVCVINNIPVILVLVNLSTKKVYWEYVNQFFVEHELKLNDTEQSKRVTFKESKVIEAGNDFIDQCHEICKAHAQVVQQREKFGQTIAEGNRLAKKDPISAKSSEQLSSAVQESVADNQQLKEKVETRGTESPAETSASANEIKKRFIQSVSSELSDKFVYYQGFVYLLEPFYLDRRGNETRQKVRELLSLTPEQENLFIQQLEQLNLVEKVGAIISVREKQQVKVLLNELLNKNELDIGQILTLFL